jgi:hypothetical protein
MINLHDGLLLLYFLIAINFLFSKMKDFNCQVQKIINDSVSIKHILNLLAVFFILVLFTRSTPMHPLIYIAVTFVMYLFFILITKCDYRFLGGFLVCMTIMFYLEADKLYKLSKNPENAEDIKNNYNKYELYIQYLSIFFVIIGVIIYIGQHSREYKHDWKWRYFWLGLPTCKGNGAIDSKRIVKDITDGAKKLFK